MKVKELIERLNELEIPEADIVCHCEFGDCYEQYQIDRIYKQASDNKVYLHIEEEEKS